MSSYQLGLSDAEGRACSASGKLLRPALCFWASQAVGGRAEQALPGALAVEWVHNFTLVHDDVQDGDALRRHRPTVWAVWGQAQAINAGDAMCAHAFELIAGSSAPAARRARTTQILASAVGRVVAGQCLDLANEGRPGLPTGAYLRMVRLKTGALIGASLALGAVLAGRGRLAGKLQHAGELLGVAFQVRDDWLGLFGDARATGKPRGDLARRKVTYPVVAAYQVASTAERRALSRLFRDRSPGATARLESLLWDLGGSRLGEATAAEIARAAVDALGKAELPAWRRAEFAALARHLSVRTA